MNLVYSSIYFRPLTFPQTTDTRALSQVKKNRVLLAAMSSTREQPKSPIWGGYLEVLFGGGQFSQNPVIS